MQHRTEKVKILTIMLSVLIIIVAFTVNNNNVASAQSEDEQNGRGSNYSLASSGSIKQNSHLNSIQPLHTDGRDIQNADGTVVILKGANFQGYEFGSFNSHTEADYALMASWGFNVVRLPIAWAYIEPEPYTYNYSYIELIKKDLYWANNYGLYVILDMHQWRWSAHFGGEGMPVWLVNGYPQSDEGKIQSVNDFWLGRAPNGTVASEQNVSMQDRYIAVWKYLASQFTDKPGVAAYDLFNEPYEGTLTPELSQGAYIYPFYNKLIDEIRAVDPNHMVIYEPIGGWDMNNAVLLPKDNIVISPHFYKFGLGSEYHSSDFAALEDSFKAYNPQVNTKNWNIPVWIGEFGTHYDANNATQYTKDIVKIFGEYKVGWAVWTYGKHDIDHTTLFYANGTERTEITTQLKQPS